MAMYPVAEGVSAWRWRWILARSRSDPLRVILQLPAQPAGFRRLRIYERSGLHVGTLGWQVCDLHERGFIAKISLSPEWQRQGLGRQMVTRALEDGPGYAWTTSAQSEVARKFFPAISAETGVDLSPGFYRCAHMENSQSSALGRGMLVRLPDGS